MSTIDTINRADGAKNHASSFQSGGLFTASSLIGWFGNAMMKRRTRLDLSELSDDLLKDVGIAPAEARRETKRFFWD